MGEQASPLPSRLVHTKFTTNTTSITPSLEEAHEHLSVSQKREDSYHDVNVGGCRVLRLGAEAIDSDVWAMRVAIVEHTGGIKERRQSVKGATLHSRE